MSDSLSRNTSIFPKISIILIKLMRKITQSSPRELLASGDSQVSEVSKEQSDEIVTKQIFKNCFSEINTNLAGTARRWRP
jgi:hypothetical protein